MRGIKNSKRACGAEREHRQSIFNVNNRVERSQASDAPASFEKK